LEVLELFGLSNWSILREIVTLGWKERRELEFPGRTNSYSGLRLADLEVTA
jgi:hypothetical protein